MLGKAVLVTMLVVAAVAEDDRIFEGYKQVASHGTADCPSPMESEILSIFNPQVPCCSPDFIFIIDITTHTGFFTGCQGDCVHNIRMYLMAVLDRAALSACDLVHATIIEYGSIARVRFDFNRFMTVAQLRVAFSNYTPLTDLGDQSNAIIAFQAAHQLITNPQYGNRPDKPNWIFWVVQTTPNNFELFLDWVNWNVKPLAVVVATGVGYQIDWYTTKVVATSEAYQFWVGEVQFLASESSKYDFVWCQTAPQTTTCEPTPTLPQPSTPPPRTTTTPPSPTEFCMDCMSRRNHKDHYADETDCHFYYQCFYNETTAWGIRRRCAPNMFWHDDILQCMPEGKVPCVDPCMADTTSAQGCYRGVGCRQFFVCANTASYGMCCPPKSRFNPNNCGCEESETCTDDCEQQGPQVQTTVKPAVGFNATVCQDSFGTFIAIVPGEANAYVLIDEEGHGTGKQYCPEGVMFDFDSCRCNTEDGVTRPPEEQDRSALLWCPFSSDIHDHSVHKFTTFAYDGAQLNPAGGGFLNPNDGRIEIPGLKTSDMGNSGSWCASFRGQTRGGILSNNKDNTASDFTVILATEGNGQCTGRLSFWHPVGGQQLSGASNNAGWNHICLIYDSNAITLHVNGVVADTKFTGGYLNLADCPYVIGHDQLYGQFIGGIRHVLITTFAMAQDEIDCHRNGDFACLAAKGFF